MYCYVVLSNHVMCDYGITLFQYSFCYTSFHSTYHVATWKSMFVFIVASNPSLTCGRYHYHHSIITGIYYQMFSRLLIDATYINYLTALYLMKSRWNLDEVEEIYFNIALNM